MNSKRSGVCLCGVPLSEHFSASDRKLSCEDVLRLSLMIRPPEPQSREPLKLVVGHKPKPRSGPKLVKG
jgi:hypothetical protein